MAIICASLPVLKAPIFRLFGLSDKIHNSSSNKYAQPFSRSNYNAKNMISSPPRIRADDASEEEFILQDVKSVRKTTEVNISYEKNNAGSNESIGGQKEATKPRREF